MSSQYDCFLSRPTQHSSVAQSKKAVSAYSKVSRYCLLALHSRVDSIYVSINGVMDVTKYNIAAILYFKSNRMFTGHKCASIGGLCITRGALPSKHETFR